MIAVLSGTSVGAASTTFGGSAEGNAVAGETDGVSGAEAVASALAAADAGAIGLAAGAIANEGAAALDDETFAVPVAADEGSAETAAAAFVEGVRG
jgi:hypothetical protein